MDNDTLIRVDNVSKKYCSSLRDSLWYGVKDICSEIYPCGNGSTSVLRRNEFWAVDNISFELKRGECLGLIGSNGAGKSTLLKILNGLIKPDRGTVTLRGRVCALIEIGTGFNPILTGRENVYINGAVLGLTRAEIEAKFDSIVAFAELEDFIDTPVRFYSSGMYMRLGFAVAAHVEPDVLLLDEVLAVGDIRFRAKCYNAIAKLKRSAAILFVSHSMPMMSRMANNCMLIDNGKMQYHGDTTETINRHYQNSATDDSTVRSGSKEIEVDAITFQTGVESNSNVTVNYGDVFAVSISLRATIECSAFVIILEFRNMRDDVVAECNNRMSDVRFSAQPSQPQTIEILIDELTLNPGIYNLGLLVMSEDMMTHYDWHRTIGRLEVGGGCTGTGAQQFKARWIQKPNPATAAKQPVA